MKRILMPMIKYGATTVLVILLVACCMLQTSGQTGAGKFEKFGIDSTIKVLVEPRYPDLTYANPSNSGTLHLKMIVDDSMVLNNYDDPVDLNNEPIALTTYSYLIGDTIRIMAGHAFLFWYFGYLLELHDEYYRMTLFLPRDHEDIRLSQSDTSKSRFIPLATSKVWLRQKPDYKLGEPIEGNVEFTTVDYYLVDNRELKKASIQVKSLFRTPGNSLQSNIEAKRIFDEEFIEK